MEHSRIVWKTDESRAIWEPRISHICSVWDRVERESVLKFRIACLQFVNNANVMGLLNWAKENHLYAQIVGATHNQIRMAFTRSKSFLHWWQERNDAIVGELLGYPNCCSEFFDRVWNHEHKFDTTLSMADPRICVSLESNILLRWAGVRFVPFLPCSFNCTKTVTVAKQYAYLMWTLDRQAYQWAREALSWPIRYSALHGAAIIDAPPFKIVATTDYTEDEVVLMRPALSHSEWVDNGFKTIVAMDEAHSKLLDAFIDIDKTEPIQSVLDLGCGNGVLLDKFLTIKPNINVYGIDTNNSALDRAEQRIPFGTFRVGDIYNAGLLPKSVSLGVVSINRFYEVGPQKALWLLEQLNKICSGLVIYSYDHDNIDKLLLGLQLVATKKYTSGGGVAAYVKLPCSIVSQV